MGKKENETNAIRLRQGRIFWQLSLAMDPLMHAETPPGKTSVWADATFDLGRVEGELGRRARVDCCWGREGYG